MTHFSIFSVAFALAGAILAVPIVGTDTQPTVRSGPASRAGTHSGSRIALGTVQAAASFRTVNPISVRRARVQTFGTHESGCADTFSRDMVTICPVEALTLPSTVQSIPLTLTTVSTHRSRVTGWANTLTRLGIAASSILTAAVRPTLVTMFTFRTFLATHWSGESRGTIALARYRIALATVQTLAHLVAILAESIGLALELAEPSPVTLRAVTSSVLGVTG